jgi:hypothetical protein
MIDTCMLSAEQCADTNKRKETIDNYNEHDRDDGGESQSQRGAKQKAPHSR